MGRGLLATLQSHLGGRPGALASVALGRPPTAGDMVALADAARDRRDWSAAARHYAAAVEQGARALGIQVQLGHALKELGDYDGAEAAYRRYLAARPDDPDIHLQFGHLCNRRNDLAAAAEWYAAAARLAPEDHDIAEHERKTRARLASGAVDTLRNQAQRLVEDEMWPEARGLYRRLVDQEGQRDLIGILANVTKEAGDFEEAAQLYERYRLYAKEHAPTLLPDVELQIGHLLKAMGDYRGALRHYIRARNILFDLNGELEADSVPAREFIACMGEIYTCFWLGK